MFLKINVDFLHPISHVIVCLNSSLATKIACVVILGVGVYKCYQVVDLYQTCITGVRKQILLTEQELAFTKGKQEVIMF